MKKNVLNAPFVAEMRKATANMYRLGWDERNGGNISYMLDEKEASEYLDLNKVIRTIPIGFSAPELVGKIFIVTGTGKYLKNVDEVYEAHKYQAHYKPKMLARVASDKCRGWSKAVAAARTFRND